MTDFIPPKPKHRKLHLSPVDALKIANRDFLDMYPAEAYSYMMGKYRLAFTNIFTINDPAGIRHVLVDAESDYPKSRFLMRMLYPLIRNGVFSSSGTVWKEQRKRLNPSFSHMHLKRAFPKMRDAADRLLERFEAAAEAGTPVDLEREFSFYTADVIFRVMFSKVISAEEAGHIFEHFQAFQRRMKNFGLTDVWKMPDWMPRFRNEGAGETAESADALRAVSFRMITERLGDPNPPDDMLSHILVEYRKEFGDDLPVEELVDQISFFFLAGHETLAASTTWSVYLYSMSRAHEDRLRAEVLAVCGDRQIEFEDLREFEFLNAVFKEALRLYPPVPYLPREAAQKDRIRSHDIAPGDICSVMPYFTQRHTRYWSDPDAFKPERFLKGGACPLDRKGIETMYFPFSTGPRVCPGAAFSTVEASILFASLIRRYSFHLVPGTKVEPLARLTLRPRFGMPMLIQKLGDPVPDAVLRPVFPETAVSNCPWTRFKAGIRKIFQVFGRRWP